MNESQVIRIPGLPDASDSQPKPLVLVGYGDLFPEAEQPDFKTLLEEVPLIVALTKVLKAQNEVHFTMFDPALAKKHVDALFNILPVNVRQRLANLQRTNPNVILFHEDATLHFCFEALKYCCDSDKTAYRLQPTADEERDILKAYLLCTEGVTSHQKIEGDALRTLLGIDLSGSEFKFHKDPKTAIYKAAKFFDFCENHPAYEEYLKAFCKDMGVADWKEYVCRLFFLFSDSMNNIGVEVDTQDKEGIRFFDRYVADRNELRAIPDWQDKGALLYLRNHFLVKFCGQGRHFYYILSPDLIVDKLYQGLKFMMYESIQKHGLMRPDGKKPFKDLPNFNQQLGQDFSETHLAYTIFADSIKDKVDAFITGEEFKAKGMKSGEPDLYIRKGRSLMLVEVKDLILGDDVKKSQDIAVVKEGILKRICKYYPDTPHKGVGQILDNIERLTKGEFQKFDVDSDAVNAIYPIVITTDNAFSAHGVNALIVEKFAEMMKNLPFKTGDRFISIPTILDIDTLINLSHRLSTGELDLFDVIADYQLRCQSRLISFKAYAWERYQRGRGMDAGEFRHLFGKVFG